MKTICKIGFLLSAIFIVLSIARGALASSSPIGLSYLAGIDTVQIAARFAVNPELFPLQKIATGEQNVFVSEMKNVFSKHEWLTITHRAPNNAYSNLVTVEFLVSGRQVELEGKPVKLGAVSFHFWKYPTKDNRATSAWPNFPPISYVFIIPETPEQLDIELRKAVQFLIEPYLHTFERAHERPKAFSGRPR